jgi:NAD(P)H-flavin reductase
MRAAAAGAADPRPAEDGPPVPRLVVVAGGVGIAPFTLLLRALVFVDADTGETEDAGLGFDEVLVLLGFRDQSQAEAAGLFEAPVQALRDAGLSARLEVISEDGSLGRCGLVTALLEDEVRSGDAVASCGAHGMCVAAWQVAQRVPGVRTWFSMEAPMACGVGSCQGCVVEGSDGELIRLCRRGPVLAGEEVFRMGQEASCPSGEEAP